MLKTENPPVVLISSLSHKIPLLKAMQNAARRIDEGARVVAGDLSPNVLSAYVADEFWNMPPTIDEKLGEIIWGCQLRGINTVLPTRDGELKFWARHADDLASHGISIITSSESALNLCIDKLLFSRFCINHDLPVIPSTTDISAIKADRYVVKERYGAGSRSIGVGLHFDEAIAHAKFLEEPIFQPYIQGAEFSVDAWVDSSNHVKALILRNRDLVVSGESKITTTFTDPLVELEIRKVIENLKLRGPVVIQAIRDSKGQLHVIECNARFGGSSTAGISAGVDSLFWSLLESRGAVMEDYPFVRYSGELRQLRLTADSYIYDPNF